MQTIIKLQNHQINTEKNSVNARELHAFIQAKQQFGNWIINRIKKYGFIENQDYISIETKKAGNNATLKEYFITLDMAKELAMVENNEKGREARRYFIRIEKQAPDEIKMLQDVIQAQNKLIANQPKQLPQNRLPNQKMYEDFRKHAKSISESVYRDICGHINTMQHQHPPKD